METEQTMYHPDNIGTKETNNEQRGKVFRTDCGGC
jgi:hypothetical protein